jgi:hypothetical protein
MGTSELQWRHWIDSTTATPNGLTAKPVTPVILNETRATLGIGSINPLAISERELQ